MKDKFFLQLKLLWARDFPSGPLVTVSCFQCRGMCLTPGQVTNILHDQKKKKTIKKKHVKKPIKKNVGGGSLFGKEVTTFYEVTKIGTSFLMLFCNPVSSTFPGLKPWQGSYTLKPSSRVVFNSTLPSVKSIPVSAHERILPFEQE